MDSVRDPVYLAALEARFAAAARHSRFVRLLRIAVPVAIGLSMLVIVGVSVFNPFRMLANLPFDVGNIVVSGSKITMQSPHMAGFTPDRRSYEVTAKTASQDVTNPNFIELDMLKARLEMEDKSTVHMGARKGYFRNRDHLLDLHDDVVLKSATYEVQLMEANIDMAKGTVVSNKPVKVRMNSGSLDAQRLEITGRGDVIIFHGGVTMHLEPAALPAQPAAK